ncbi:MAG TPA: hypothetical protein VH720_13130 [Candidatus Limnocylindrales bacterium]
MPVDKQPSPESWDDESGAQPPSNGGADGAMATGLGAIDGPVETTSGESESIGAKVADQGSTFLADLARAMQAAAGAERTRATEDADRRRESMVTEIRSRVAAEASQLEQQADVEIAEIGAWAEAQMERIRDERERRIEARRETLSRRLDEQRLIADRQADAIEEAVTTHRAELEGFFKRLDMETDPSAIARLARMRPEFPPLETIAARARTAAAADALGDEPEPRQEPVGVMDPDAGTSSDRPWAVPEPATTPVAGASEATVAPGTAHEEPEPAAVGPRSSGALLGSVPALRPIGSWLNRDRAEGSGGRDQG